MLVKKLLQLADECARDDSRATSAPWTWTDDAFLWNAQLDQGVLNHGDTLWPVAPDNREVIAAARNRLPDLASLLRSAAKRIDLLEQLVAQDSAARDRLRDQIDELERALARAAVR